jgi:hypothetical protein
MDTRRSHEDGFPRTVYVAGKQLQLEHDVRQPGQLVMEALDWKPEIRNKHLGLGWLKEVDVVTPADRKAVKEQLAQEEATRAQLAAQHREQEEAAQQQAPPPAPVPEGAVTLHCANCKRPTIFPEMPGMRAIWQCDGCGQRQSPEQAKAGTLQVIAGHTYNHNRMESNWRPHYG